MIDRAKLSTLVDAIHDRAAVSGLTHDFYRYPARFSPLFVRAAMQAFTRPGDIILDPFVGGGTTLVEAKALGRSAVGTDISELATFLARVKTTLLGNHELAQVAAWTDKTTRMLSPSRVDMPTFPGSPTNLPWRVRKMAAQALAVAGTLPQRPQRFVRCVLLRTVQWAVDGKRGAPPTAEAFRSRLRENARSMIQGMCDLRSAAAANRHHSSRLFIRVSNHHASDVRYLTTSFSKVKKPKLVITSPPYPGVHVLYHRWQVEGRKETPAPFWIAGCDDGCGASHYTLGDRGRRNNSIYFDSIERSFHAVGAIIDKRCVVLQLVGFANPAEDLPRYLDAMERAGFAELPVPAGLTDCSCGQLWRDVPNRKWHASMKGPIQASRERLLLHRLRT